jgi:hypothetical protein
MIEMDSTILEQNKELELSIQALEKTHFAQREQREQREGKPREAQSYLPKIRASNPSPTN